MDASCDYLTDISILGLSEERVQFLKIHFESFGRLVFSNQVIKRRLDAVLVELMKAGQVKQGGLLDNVVVAFSALLVKSKDGVLVLDVQVVVAQLKSNLADHLGHPLNCFLRVLLEVECSDHVWGEVVFDHLDIKPLHDAEDSFDSLNPDFAGLVTQQFLDLGQVNVLKACSAPQGLVMVEEDVFNPENSVKSDFVVHVLTNAGERLNHYRHPV